MIFLPLDPYSGNEDYNILQYIYLNSSLEAIPLHTKEAINSDLSSSQG
jgi:hypothetical protein